MLTCKRKSWFVLTGNILKNNSLHQCNFHIYDNDVGVITEKTMYYTLLVTFFKVMHYVK